MIRRSPRKTFALTCTTVLVTCFIASMSMVVSASAVPLGHTSGVNCHSVADCGGDITGSPGTHAGQNPGSGYWSGHTVQLNGYMPIQSPLLIACNNPTVSLFENLGYNAKKVADYGQEYLHYEVAIDRDTGEAIGGAPGTKYWDTSWNLDTYNKPGGVGRADVPLAHDPSKNDKWHGWAGANWWLFGNKNQKPVCLPLTGGVPVIQQLKQDPATIAFSTGASVVVGMHKEQVTFSVDQKSINNAIAVNFALEKYQFSVIRKFTNKDGTPGLTWTMSDDPKTPVKFKALDSPTDPTQRFAMTIKKTGDYVIVVNALFTGTVVIDGVPTFNPALPAYSASTPLHVQSVTSVNRS